MIPHKVADHHVQVCDVVLERALLKAKLTMKDISLIVFSQGPGLGHALRIGAFAARTLAVRFHLPIIGVDHCVAHVAIGELLTPAKDPVLLYASGANTQIIAYEGKKYRIFGETLDQGVGNFLDSFARYAGLGFPGGPKIDALARKGKRYIALPYTVKGMDVSFGGLLTNVKQKYDSGRYRMEDLAYSIQETVFAMLVEVAERALAHCKKTELLLAGGVACNQRLQQMCSLMCKARSAQCFVPQNEYLLDNGAMITWLGILMYQSGKRMELTETTITPYERTDDVEVTWK